jgi:hypothetical protein
MKCNKPIQCSFFPLTNRVFPHQICRQIVGDIYIACGFAEQLVKKFRYVGDQSRRIYFRPQSIP